MTNVKWDDFPSTRFSIKNLTTYSKRETFDEAEREKKEKREKT
jgi:hypothetical protein